ncbi:hypothetical protein PTTG_29611 [Puccinia triticina 1-1 BBBD Race 1]|uniref:Secreted protein n=2 Tax=Puccinia triticina TaxID=208348 RepID=A0A180G3J9_PUCT1|nr:uncharacterized protein PtA15_9A516 [Puccinia triticina]OAV87029.1 hypothetical protein PTTG_29611 [Puccinia triticina 1-1 BBBD Race 1]WAQ88389.1 hypothetical protein PtA15_9A516 [Puccinia triticina]
MKLSILAYGPLMALILSTMVLAQRRPKCPGQCDGRGIVTRIPDTFVQGTLHYPTTLPCGAGKCEKMVKKNFYSCSACQNPNDRQPQIFTTNASCHSNKQINYDISDPLPITSTERRPMPVLQDLFNSKSNEGASSSNR